MEVAVNIKHEYMMLWKAVSDQYHGNEIVSRRTCDQDYFVAFKEEVDDSILPDLMVLIVDKGENDFGIVTNPTMHYHERYIPSVFLGIAYGRFQHARWRGLLEKPLKVDIYMPFVHFEISMIKTASFL